MENIFATYKVLVLGDSNGKVNSLKIHFPKSNSPISLKWEKPVSFIDIATSATMTHTSAQSVIHSSSDWKY